MTAPAITAQNLFQILVDCAGEGEPLTTEALDTPFEDLDYDSLALIEAAARIKQLTGVAIPDEDLMEVSTPQDMLTLINSLGA